jgi:HEAT repeat protein
MNSQHHPRPPPSHTLWCYRSRPNVALSGLQSEEPEVAQAAVGCIGRHGDADALAELIPAVQHQSWAVRGEAIQTLGDRRVVRALPAILRRLETEQDSFVRDVIVRSLRRLEE